MQVSSDHPSMFPQVDGPWGHAISSIHHYPQQYGVLRRFLGVLKDDHRALEGS